SSRPVGATLRPSDGGAAEPKPPPPTPSTPAPHPSRRPSRGGAVRDHRAIVSRPTIRRRRGGPRARRSGPRRARALLTVLWAGKYVRIDGGGSLPSSADPRRSPLRGDRGA